MKNKVFVFLRIAASFGMLGLLFWIMRDEIRDIWGTIVKCDVSFLVLAGFFLFADTVMLGFRLTTVFKGENLNVSFKKSFQLTYLGYYFNNFMPSAVGGDIIKAYYASRDSSKEKIRSYASVFMDRFIGLCTLLIIAAVALVIDNGKVNQPEVKKLVYILLAIGVVVFSIVMNKTVAGVMKKIFSKVKVFRIGEHLDNLYRIVHDYRNRKTIVSKAVVMSIVAQYFYFLTVYFFFLAVGANMSLGNIFLIMPIVTFISMVPSIGGLGFREGAMVIFFSSLAGREAAFAVSLLLLFGLLAISIIGGAIYLWWGFSRARSSSQVKNRRIYDENTCDSRTEFGSFRKEGS
ncbi:MAG: lysylphosphatidylglycerol synthase transmembrane domain-containing protein [Candidatus Omnitrophota bacterium]